MKWERCLLVVALVVPVTAVAQQDSTKARKDTVTSVSFGGFVDTYYARQFGRNSVGDIPFLTQPVRNREFNINLMYVDARVSAPRWRGRLALQAGTSVQANYNGEPVIGLFSGPLLARHIQEAVAGYYLGDNVWVDAGIYFSHIGSEGWISRDNWTYTRSLIADWSPYFETGVKVTWSPSAKFTGLFTVVNGWQIISETNNNKAIGMRADFSPSPNVTLFYSNFFGNELADTLEGHTRVFNDVGVKVLFGEVSGIMGTFDWGKQDDFDWYGFSVIGRVRVAKMVAVVGRVERFSDPDQVLILTGLNDGFASSGFSLGVDLAPPAGFLGIGPASRFLWRTEFRALPADERIFPRISLKRTAFSDMQSFIVSSFALTF